MNLTLVYNSKSGGAISASKIKALCESHGIVVDRAVPIGGDMTSVLQSAITNNAYIAALGGDGTISAVARAVVNTGATLVPLPGGTLNHFTKDLHVPQDIEIAIARLKDARPIMVDTVKVNDHLFINNSSIGLYPLSLRVRAEYEPRFGKLPAAIIGVLKALFRFKVYEVDINGRTVRTPFVFIGNNEYVFSTLTEAERPSLTEGNLSVILAHSSSRLVTLKNAFKIVVRHNNFDPSEIELFTTKHLEIHRRNNAKLSVSFDGEIVSLKTPIKYEILPSWLRVLA